LHEKQKAKRIYFTLEGQFREYYEKANRSTGVTGEILIQQLERRLDSVVFRLGFAISRRQSRQIVRHGHITVNGKKVNIPSYQTKVGDEIAVLEASKKLIIIEQGVQSAAQNPVPAWLQANFETMSGRILSLPRRDDVNLPVNEQLIVELYSK
jgi:small subunit ribosomal protein S4